MLCGVVRSIQFSPSVVSDSLRPHGLQHARLPCPSPTPGVYSNSCPLSRWCHPTISSSVSPSPLAYNLYWAPTDLGSSSFSVLSFCLFILFMGFSRQEYWSGVPFPSPVDRFYQNSSPWPVHRGWPYMDMAHSFIELDKTVVRVIRFVPFLWLCVEL